jgi:cation transport regulator ChaB
MPYRSNKDLPPAVKDALPAAAQDIYRNVANSVLAEGGDEQAAARQAWGAVKNAGYEKDKASGKWRKVGKALSFSEALATMVKKAEYQGRQVELNKPFRTTGGNKKFAVYVKDGDSVKIVRFGDPDMEIRRDDPKARANFRARHRCDQQKDKTTAAYWSCKMWEAGATVSDLTKGDDMTTDLNPVTLNAEIHKTNEDKRLVYAWASVVTKGGKPVADLQGDIVTVDELEKAAHGFMLNSREAGEMHIKTTGIGKVVESVVLSKALQEALGVDLGQEGWLVVMKIEDDAVWERVKKGELSMLSIGGRGRRG